MRGPHNIVRLIRTGATFQRTGAMREVLTSMQAPRSVRVASKVAGWLFEWAGLPGDPTQPPILRALTALGPAYIKFGQILSTRPDVVGPAMAAELQVLQDRLPAFDRATAVAVIEAELGQPLGEVFSFFSEPIAAASIAQVHRATLSQSGRTVAVKLLRPGVERAFRRDVDAFHLAARLIELLSPASRRLRPRDVIAHFEDVVDQELDLRAEAAAAGEFAANIAQDRGFRVPQIEWGLSTRRVMVLEWAEGINFSKIIASPRAPGEGDIPPDPAADLAPGPAPDLELGPDPGGASENENENTPKQGAPIDRARIARTVLQMYLRHALRDGYFHADMHHGNLKLAPNGDIVALDFGIMGRIDGYTRRVYAEILMGFIRRDYRRVAEVHFEAGYVPPDRDVGAFAQALRSVGEPIFGMDAAQISMGRLMAYLFEVTERFGMETRTELILLQRSMVVVEGVARSIDPAVNIWTAAQPVVEEYIRDNIGPRAIMRDLSRTALVLSRFGPRLPRIAREAVMAQVRPPEPSRPPRRLLLGTFGAGLAAGALAAALVALM